LDLLEVFGELAGHHDTPFRTEAGHDVLQQAYEAIGRFVQHDCARLLP
jgi:hypothetical protein